MPMKGRFPLRRTLRYLEQGHVHLKDTVKIVTINYKTHGDFSEGTRDFVFYNLPQLQYKNPTVQMKTFQNITPSPYIRCFLDDGNDVLIDTDSKSNLEILEHLNKVLGKSEEVLERERKAQERQSNPAHFGSGHRRRCICEIPGQVPCPGKVSLPKELRGKYRDLKADSLKPPRGVRPDS
ncbi:28S ribosomal protein S25, mitochondrial-like [Patiria miniata]|uniref:Small ribosomal subunit protein mS25 n=1 Tax=Patiria miniata TaxID=46514 RepID=A0A914AXS4_PATMI|nr:28S ribosomal protein S25, mitochondrial-like [Patiria miniata]